MGDVGVSEVAKREKPQPCRKSMSQLQVSANGGAVGSLASERNTPVVGANKPTLRASSKYSEFQNLGSGQLFVTLH